jgi:F-type H+-transporting ATPase subunit epsilon
MAASFQLEIVSADRMVWEGEATMVIARTLEGEIGVLANHSPLLGVLAPGVVEIRPAEGSVQLAAIDGGFADGIDRGQAEQDLERARQKDDDSESSRHAVAAAEARVAAAERAT